MQKKKKKNDRGMDILTWRRAAIRRESELVCFAVDRFRLNPPPAKPHGEGID